KFQGVDPITNGEDHTNGGANTKSPRDPAQSRRPRARPERSCTRTGRPGRHLRRSWAADRWEKAKARRPTGILPSRLSAVGCPPWFEPFIGTTPESNSWPAYPPRFSSTFGLFPGISFQYKISTLSGTEHLEFLPSVNDRIGIDFLDAHQNAVSKLLPGFHPDAPQEETRHLSEQRLDQVKPRSLLRRQSVFGFLS